jgi:dTDP-4-dehydrorhamnose 3,5-epimerase
MNADSSPAPGAVTSLRRMGSRSRWFRPACRTTAPRERCVACTSPDRREAKLVRCERGRIFDVVVDLRPQSPSYLKHVEQLLDADEGTALYLPPGLAHGFQTLVDDSTVCYMMSEAYRADLADGVRYDDLALGIRWPMVVSVIAERDRCYPDFDAERHAARFGAALAEAFGETG